VKKLLLVLVVALCLASSVNAAITDNIVAYWNFNESAGNFADMFVGHTLTNSGASYGAAGMIGNAADFENTQEDYAYRADHDDFSFTNGAGTDEAFSISCWYKPESVGTEFLVAKTASATSGEYYVAILGTYLRMHLYDDTSFTSYLDIVSTEDTLSAGNWYHFVATYDGSELNTGLELYLNNDQQTVTRTSSGYTGMANTNREFDIGRRESETGYDSDGVFDDCGVWNRELSAAEVASIYANGMAGHNITYGALIVTTIPSWVAPTPTNNTANSLQVVLNASCGVNRTYLWFDANANPSTLVVNNASTGNYTTVVGASGVYYYKAACWNATTGFSANTSVRKWTYDIVNPNIVLNLNNEFNAQNYSLLDAYDNSVVLSMNFTDNIALYAYEVIISNSSGGVVWNETSASLSGLKYWYNKTVSATGWPSGRYDVQIAVADTHTKKDIKDYGVVKGGKKLVFETAEGNLVSVESDGVAVSNAIKKGDRYVFAYDFAEKGSKKRVFTVTASNPIVYRPDTGFKAHFVIPAGRPGEGGNWVDFEGVSEVPEVVKVDDYHYLVKFASLADSVVFQSIGGLNVINTSYSFYRGSYAVSAPYATVSDPFVMGLNVTEDGNSTLNVSFTYNGTARVLSMVNGSGWRSWNVSITMSSNLTFAYKWTVNNTQDDGNFSQFNVSGSHKVNAWLMGKCAGVLSSKRIRWNLKNENTPDSALSGTMELYATYWPNSENNSKFLNLSYTSASYFELCAYPSNLTFYMNIYAKHVYPATYTHRFYVQNGTFAGNTWTNYSIYNFASITNISLLKLTVRHNTDYSYFLNVLAYLQRYYVGAGVWRTVQMDKSGDYGALSFDVREKDTDYRILFYDENNSLLHQTESMKLVCSGGVCDLTKLLSVAAGSSSTGGLSSSISFNNATKVLTINWADAVLNTSVVTLKVTKQTMSGQNTVCSAVQNGSGGSYACNLSSYTGSMFVTVDSTSENVLAEWFDVPAPKLSDYMGVGEQALWSFAVLVTVVMVGLFSPVAVLIAGVIGMIFLLFMGLFSPLTVTVIIIAGAVATFIGIKVRN
jgi:hypothetical protein